MNFQTMQCYLVLVASLKPFAKGLLSIFNFVIYKIQKNEVKKIDYIYASNSLKSLEYKVHAMIINRLQVNLLKLEKFTEDGSVKALPQILYGQYDIQELYILDLKTKVFCSKMNQIHLPMATGLTVQNKC